VREAIDERLGPLVPALETVLQQRGVDSDELARPPLIQNGV
jgi:riboflavin synthase